jgi:16S rRNA processing protein RimM
MSEVSVDARLIGVIGKPHGIKGEITVVLLTDYPKTIKSGDTLFFDEKCKKKIDVESIRWKKIKRSYIPVIKFKGIDSRNDAENLKGARLFRSVKDSPKLKENEYWVDDIINCMVYTKNNIFVGKVVNVEKFAANDNLAVKIENKDLDIRDSNSNIFYIPVIEIYIESINLKDKKIILKKIPEYI